MARNYCHRNYATLNTQNKDSFWKITSSEYWYFRNQICQVSDRFFTNFQWRKKEIERSINRMTVKCKIYATIQMSNSENFIKAELLNRWRYQSIRIVWRVTIMSISIVVKYLSLVYGIIWMQHSLLLRATLIWKYHF